MSSVFVMMISSEIPPPHSCNYIFLLNCLSTQITLHLYLCKWSMIYSVFTTVHSLAGPKQLAIQLIQCFWLFSIVEDHFVQIMLVVLDSHVAFQSPFVKRLYYKIPTKECTPTGDKLYHQKHELDYKTDIPKCTNL